MTSKIPVTMGQEVVVLYFLANFTFIYIRFYNSRNFIFYKLMQKVLVTGNLGYIGSVLTKKLINLGYFVVGFDVDALGAGGAGGAGGEQKQQQSQPQQQQGDSSAAAAVRTEWSTRRHAYPVPRSHR